MRNCFLAVLISIGFAAAGMAAEGSPSERDVNSKWEHYTVVVEKNIFSRIPGKGPGSASSAQGSAPIALAGSQPEADIVLVGIVQKDGLLSAFVENRKTNAMQIVRAGEPVASGKAGVLTLDSIEYIAGESKVIIPIGKNMAGGDPPKLVDTVKAADVPSGDKAGDDQTVAKPASGETNDILERMRKKRQEELRK